MNWYPVWRESVWTLADCEWRAAAPGLKPLRLPHTQAQCKKPAKFQTAVSVCQFLCPRMLLWTVMLAEASRSGHPHADSLTSIHSFPRPRGKWPGKKEPLYEAKPGTTRSVSVCTISAVGAWTTRSPPQCASTVPTTWYHNSRLAKRTLQLQVEQQVVLSSESYGALLHGSSRDVSTTVTYRTYTDPLSVAFKVLTLATRAGAPDSHHCIVLCLLEQTQTWIGVLNPITPSFKIKMARASHSAQGWRLSRKSHSDQPRTAGM